MPNGEVLYVEYNKESDTLDVGQPTNAGLVAQHPYTAVSYNGSWYALAGRKFEFFKNQRDNDYTHDAPQNGYFLILFLFL